MKTLVINLSHRKDRLEKFKENNAEFISYDVLKAPCDTCVSIIGLLGSNPVQLTINTEEKVEGRGALVEGKSIKGGFIVTIPFALQLEPMTFMGGIGTEINFGAFDTRYKIRNSLVNADMVTEKTISFPFGA